LGGGGGGEGAGKKETTFSSLTLTLTASPDVIEPGGSSTLVWQSNATNCIASGGWSGGKSASGQETVKPNLTADYTLTCSRQSETVSKIMKITLLGQQQTEENLPSQNPSPPIENPVAANPVEPLFSRDLLFGERSQEVRKLQELLATDRSLYPEGLVTGYFGRLTQLALGRFQVRYGLVTSTTPGREEYRRVGIATRRKLAEVFGSGNGSGSQVLEPSRKLYRALRFGSRGEDVRVLQEFLASDPAIYPQRLVTGYFGRFTRLAVIRFQQKYNTPQLQTERGIVGPYTLIKLDEMLE
jgi:peptidoglycan hydrolase-like protein with peptidoglycan-binding domain